MREIKLTPFKTYKNEENATKAINKIINGIDVKYFLTYTKEGRCYPVFIGEKCIQYGIHFHFIVVF